MRSGDCPSWDLGSNNHRLGGWGSETVTPSAEVAGGDAREETVVWVEILTSGAALASAFSSWKASWAPWFPPACSLHRELEACCHISPWCSWNRSQCSPDSEDLGIKPRNLLCHFHKEATDPLSTNEGEASTGETAKSNTWLCSPVRGFLVSVSMDFFFFFGLGQSPLLAWKIEGEQQRPVIAEAGRIQLCPGKPAVPPFRTRWDISFCLCTHLSLHLPCCWSLISWVLLAVCLCFCARTWEETKSSLYSESYPSCNLSL